MERVRTAKNIHDRQNETIQFAKLILVVLGKDNREMEHASIAMTTKNSKEKMGDYVDLTHVMTYQNY